MRVKKNLLFCLFLIQPVIVWPILAASENTDIASVPTPSMRRLQRFSAASFIHPKTSACQRALSSAEQSLIERLLEARHELPQSHSDRAGWDAWLRNHKLLGQILPSYDPQAKSIHFEFETPGVEMHLEHGPYDSNHSLRLDYIKNFRLVYDPAKTPFKSVLRHMFGRRPVIYGTEDISATGQCAFLGDPGTHIQIFLKPKAKRFLARSAADGGMIMIARDTGQIRFWPPGTNVDADFEGIMRGSLVAFARHWIGLWQETQNQEQMFIGEWFTEDSIIDVGR